MKNKDFDAVRMMREIREKRSLIYWEHPGLLKKGNGRDTKEVST